MQVPPQYKDSIDVDPSTMTYAPHTWFNDFWLLRDYMVGGGCHPSLCSLHHLPSVFASSSPSPHITTKGSQRLLLLNQLPRLPTYRCP